MDDLRQQRHLVALVSFPTLTAAAESVGLTKSALSKSIQRIEDLYGVKIIERSRQGIQITAYGEVLIDAAQRGIEMFSQARRQLDLLRNLKSGRLVIGCDPLIAEVLLSRTIVRVMASHPGLKLVIKSGFWAEHQKTLTSGEIDLFVGLKPDQRIKEFAVRQFMLPGIVGYCRAGHPLTRVKNLTLADAYQFPVVGPSMPNWFYSDIHESFDPARDHLRRREDLAVLANDEGMIREIVKSSDAISGGFFALIADDVKSGRLEVLPLNTRPLRTPFSCIIASRQNRPLPPAAALVISVMESVASQLVAISPSDGSICE